MRSTMKWLLPLLLSASAFATTRTAATCNNTDVQTAINASIDGDTVNVPTGSCTWTASVTVSSGISIIGAGSSSTTILDNIFQNNMFKVTLGSASQVLRVSGMSLLPSPSLNSGSAIGPGNGAIATVTGTCNSSSCSQIRFDHLAINGWLYGTGGTQNFGGFLMTVNNVFGVLDHLNVAFTTQGEFIAIGQGSYGGVGSNGDNSWAQADSYGTGNALYIEASTFTDVAGTGMAITDTDFGGGGRLVVRFNTLTNASVQTHGTESTGRQRGVRQVEVYNNALTCTNNSAGCDFVGLRSGTIHFFNNSITLSGGGFSNNGVSLSNYRDSTVFSPWGVCNGSGPYDHNDGTVYASGTITSLTEGPPLVLTDNTKSWTTNQWVQSGDPYGIADTTNGNGCQITGNTVTTATCDNAFWSGPPTMTVGHSYQILRASACNDFTGRGAGTLLSGTTPSPTGWTNEVIDPAYVWGNTGSTPNFGWINSRTQEVIANRDYYNQNASFTGTTGTGTGVLASRPATCTTGVAYWATDQGSWNTSGSGGQGVLYTCTATNTWSLTYTPYAYPNPLTSSGGGGGGGGQLPNLGENCASGCGIGSHIIPTTVVVTLCDTANPNCSSNIVAQTQISGYGTLPLTIDPTSINFDWDTDVPANGCVVLGSLANNSDRIQCDTTGSTFNISTHHHVTVKNLIPASHNGNAGGSMTAYVTSNINATPTDPQNRYSLGQNTWPGPQCYAGSTNCYLNFFPPNPTAAMPMTWNGTVAGVPSATRGFPAQIPLYLLWKGGNSTSVAGFGPCTSAQANYSAHKYPTDQWSAPNDTPSNWYTCNGAGTWVQQTSLPAFVATSVSLTQGGNTYTCPGNVNGGHNPTTRVPTATCTGTAGDSHISVTPYYAGQWAGSSSSTDYRPVHYSSGLTAYWMDMNAAAPPANAQPTSTLEFYPAANGLTGDVTVNLTLTMYTNSSLTTPSGGTPPIDISYTIHVGDNTPITQVDPSSYPTDANMPAYMNYLSQQSVQMCSESGDPYSMDYFNLGINYWMWLTFSAGDWGPFNTGNYDGSRTFMESGDFFLSQMNGSAWPDWIPTNGYGNTYARMEVTPSTDPNGNTWLATVPGAQSGSTPPNWASIPSPRSSVLLTDGAQKWRNVGKRSYWNRCNENAGIPFLNQVIQANGSAQWAQFTGALEKNRQRTDDTLNKGVTPITGLYSAGEKAQINSDFGAGVFSQFSASAGRGPAYQVMAWATYWKTVCDESNCAAFTGNDEYKRMVFWQINATINYWDIHENSNAVVADVTKTYWPTFDPLHFGVGAEALIEWYIRDKELDPSNSLGLLDPRIVPAIKQMLDFAWVNWYNQCSIYESTSNYSMSYNPMDVQTCAILEPYFTELTGPIQAAYDFMGRFAANATIPGTSTTYFQAADTIRMHMYDGRNCGNPQGKWFCQQYGIPWGGGSGVPKAFGQTTKWTMGDSYQYRTGAWTPFEDDLSPQHNPCWTGGSTPCGSSTPYPDTAQPYMVQILPSNAQDDPNCENHSTGQTCSPIQNVASTTATVQFNVYEQTSQAWVNYGRTNACADGQVRTEAGGFPQLRNSSNQLYKHNFNLTNLLPNTQYWVQMCAIDNAGNQACNSCATVPGNFRGGNINFTTTGQTLLTVVTTTLPSGIVGTGYSQTLMAAGGIPPYSWSITSGTLPTGLNLNATSGLISGTPSVGGSFTFTVRVTDSASNHADQPLTIVISDLVVSTISFPPIVANVPYSTSVQATGGTPPYTWTELGKLPTGITLAADGTISGTATVCATYPIAWSVKDANGLGASKPINLVVQGCGFVLTITTTTLPGGMQGQPYNAQLNGSGGTQLGYSWSVIVGTLPAGISLNATTGALTGTPTGIGESDFTVQLTDSGGNTATAPLSITIQSSLLVITTPSLPSGASGIPYTTTILATGGLQPYTWCVQEASGLCDNGSNGALPPGLTMATVANNGVVAGTPTTVGTYNFIVQVTDSLGSPATRPMSIVIQNTSQFSVTINGHTTITGNTTIH